MKTISIDQNSPINKILHSISETVFSEENLSQLKKNVTLFPSSEKECGLIKDFKSTDDEYFYKAKSEYDISDFGFPTSKFFLSGTEDVLLSRLISKKVRRLQRKLCAKRNALVAFYPENGYIGWHHNGNAPGYNILLSYNHTGSGRFKFYDYECDEIRSIEDEKGWNAKVGYYPDQYSEPERVFWHEAETEGPRLSVAFIVDDKELWKDMIVEITNDQYEREEIESQGPKKKSS